ncbi:MAG: hypothetical protein RLN70_06990 [Rhodospirillaceae bacterium]
MINLTNSFRLAAAQPKSPHHVEDSIGCPASLRVAYVRSRRAQGCSNLSLLSRAHYPGRHSMLKVCAEPADLDAAFVGIRVPKEGVKSVPRTVMGTLGEILGAQLLEGLERVFVDPMQLGTGICVAVDLMSDNLQSRNQLVAFMLRKSSGGAVFQTASNQPNRVAAEKPTDFVSGHNV